MMRRGFTINELLMTLSLLVIFFAASGEIFRSTVLLSSAGEKVSDQASQTDAVLGKMRRDVWNAKAITVRDPSSVAFSGPDKSNVSWKISGKDGIDRTDGAGVSQHWAVAGIKWSLSTDGISLVISDGSSAPVRMVSQVLLAEKEGP